ncbi:MAG: hypothetical protein ACRELT_15000 [Longimicrobiales bacterium]
MTANSAPDTPDDGRRTIPREQDAPRLLIVLIILLMLSSVSAAYVWIQRSGFADMVVGLPAPLAGGGPIFLVDQVVAEPARANLLGRDVAIWGVPVHDVPGDWLFWIGAHPDSVIPVVLLGEQTARQHERQTEVRAGDTVAVFGTVRAVRDISVLDRGRRMPRVERARLVRAQVYVSALRVEHISRGRRVE